MSAEEQLMRGLYEQHVDVVFAFVLRYVPDRQAAEDVVQETMLRAWRHLDRATRSAAAPGRTC